MLERHGIDENFGEKSHVALGIKIDDLETDVDKTPKIKTATLANSSRGTVEPMPEEVK